MQKTLITILFILGGLTVSAAVHRVGTYNILTVYSDNDTKVDEKKWANRKEAVMKVIRDSAEFDVVALQEVKGSQPQDLKNSLGDTFSFVSTDNSSNQLLYRKSKYNCLDHGVFYLAKDITKPGKDWGATEVRFVVWAKLQDKATQEIFFFAATHLDVPDHPEAVREGARIVTEQMMKICGDYACIIGGDMNCELVEHDPHSYYCANFGNARDMTKTAPQGPYNTYVGSRKPYDIDGKLIDFVYVRGMEVESYEVNTAKCGLSILPSDHMPVVCEVTLLPYNRKRTHVVSNVDELRAEAGKIPAGEIIYLKRGKYDLGNEPLSLSGSCVIQGNEEAYLTGSCQLFTLANLVSLELRELTIKDATCPQGGFGSIANGNGRYVRLTDCTIDNCTTNGSGLIYADDCALEVDHCLFQNNDVPYGEGCLHTLGRDVFPTTIKNSTFRGNHAFRGPALYHTSTATAYIYGNSFVENTADDKGVLVLMAAQNKSDIRLVNNSFIGNRIDVEASFTAEYTGGSAIWEELSNEGGMTLMNNTIVGNYTACWDEPGVTNEEFASGAIYSVSGMLGAYNNIIAGNYSSRAGRGDIVMANPTLLRGGANNIFSSEDNTNYPIGMFDLIADNYAAACTELVTLLGGSVVDGIYTPVIKTYGENQDVYALSPLSTRYADQDINILDAEAMTAAYAGSDIMNVGSLSGTLTQDQSFATRNALSVPGSMEMGQDPTSLPSTPYPLHPTPYTKLFINGQIVIEKNGRCYSILGSQL